MTTASLSAPRGIAAPRPALAVAAGVGLGAGYVIPNGPPGIGLVLLGWVAAGLLWWLSPGPVRGWRIAHALLALLLLSVAAVRDAPWLVALSLLMAIGLGSLSLTPAGGWAAVARGLVEVGLVLPRSIGWLLRGVRGVPVLRTVTGPVARGSAVTVLLLAVFVPLLATADAVFGRLVGDVLPGLPDLGLLPVRFVVAGAAAVGVAAGLLVLLAPRAEPVVGPAAYRLSRAAEWLLPLAVLDGLLGLFVVLQATVLFGGDDHVLRTAGVTYASYARQGFGQLIAVAALVLLVVAAAVRWAPRAARPGLAVLCGLALVIDASALWRLHLYVDAYGLSRLRLTASALAGWLGVVLVILLVAGVRPGRWVPHTVVASAAVGLLALAAVNPDARIADSVLDRGPKADLRYVATLSADAAPDVHRRLGSDGDCAVIDEQPRRHESWTSGNLGRHRAAAVFPSYDVLCRR